MKKEKKQCTLLTMNYPAASGRRIFLIKQKGNKTKLSKNRRLYEYVIKKLKNNGPPETISGRLKLDYPNDKDMHISYEAIYQYIYAQIHRGGVSKSGVSH